MNRFSITRTKNTDDEILPEFKITMEEWSNLIQKIPSLIWIGETIYGKDMDKNSISWHSQICFEWETTEDFPKVLISNPSIFGYLRIRIQKRTKIRQIEKLLEIANELNCFLLDEKNKEITDTVIDRMKIEQAKKKLLKNPIFKNGFNKQARWLAIKSIDSKKILEVLGLKKFESFNWEEGFKIIDNSDQFLMTSPIYSWSIITGINTPYLLYKDKEQFNLTKNHFDHLTKNLVRLSSIFGNVQYFEHNNQNDKCNGYFKAINGKFIYGKYHSVNEIFEKGKAPKELKKIIDDSAFKIANLWSVDPLDLVYFKEMKNKEVFIFDKKL